MFALSEKNSRLIYTIGTVLLILLILLLVLTRLLGFFSPFLIALLITSLIEKPVRLLEERVKLPRGISVAIIMFLFVVVVGTIIVFLFSRLLMEVWNLAKDSPGLQSVIFYLRELMDASGTWYTNLPEEIVNTIQANINGVMEKISNSMVSLINNLLKIMVGTLQSLPQVFLYIIISLVSAFFMSRDKEKISRFVFGQLPHSWRDKIRSIKGDLLLAFIGYIKAQMILIFITFLQVLVGYSMIGVQYALFLAIITAIMDLLPILGPGTILIPSAVIYMMAGNKLAAIGFIILYISVLLVRQLLEPRIVGGHVGLHPLTTLIFIYLGFRVFGVMGIVLGPVFAIIVKALQKAKVLPQWKPA